jgi:hypothetical protein
MYRAGFEAPHSATGHPAGPQMPALEAQHNVQLCQQQAVFILIKLKYLVGVQIVWRQ